MKSPEINPFSSDYRNIFGHSYIRQFDVYAEVEKKVGSTENVRSGERVGQLVNVLANPSGQLQDIVVDLIAPTKKQVRLPLSQTQIDQRSRHIYVIGLSKAELINLPPYETSRVTANSEPPSEYSSNEYSGKKSVDKPFNEYTKYDSQSNQGTTVRLYEEQLVVDRGQRRKVGEVIVRKEIETRIVEVPVRHEKLIVEQVSPVYEQLAVVDMSPNQSTLQDRVAQNITGTQGAASPNVVGEFTSAESASRFLDAIAHHPNAKPEKIQIKIVLQDPTEQATYQRWLERYLA